MGRLQTVTMPLNDKIRIVDSILKNLRVGARAGNAVAAENYEVLKSVAADLQARHEIARRDTLVEIEAALDRVKRSPHPSGNGYDDGQLIQLAVIIIRRWATVAQALEQFEKETA